MLELFSGAAGQFAFWKENDMKRFGVLLALGRAGAWRRPVSGPALSSAGGFHGGGFWRRPTGGGRRLRRRFSLRWLRRRRFGWPKHGDGWF